MSAKRKDNAEVFIPSRPELNLNPQPSAVFPDQEKACSSKSSGSPRAGLGLGLGLGPPQCDACSGSGRGRQSLLCDALHQGMSSPFTNVLLVKVSREIEPIECACTHVCVCNSNLRVESAGWRPRKIQCSSTKTICTSRASVAEEVQR